MLQVDGTVPRLATKASDATIEASQPGTLGPVGAGQLQVDGRQRPQRARGKTICAVERKKCGRAPKFALLLVHVSRVVVTVAADLRRLLFRSLALDLGLGQVAQRAQQARGALEARQPGRVLLELLRLGSFARRAVAGSLATTLAALAPAVGLRVYRIARVAQCVVGRAGFVVLIVAGQALGAAALLLCQPGPRHVAALQ